MRGLEAGPPQRVALVNMPFAGANRPSIQCGLLKAGLVREGHEVDVHYLNLELAAEIGEVTYRKLADLRWDHLLGEWLFSAAAFGPREDEEEYREAHPSLQETLKQLEEDFDELRRMRNELFPQLIARWADGIDWGAYGSSASPPPSSRTSPRSPSRGGSRRGGPEVVIVFGGANFDGEMGPEYVRAFPWIDYAVVGEGDRRSRPCSRRGSRATRARSRARRRRPDGTGGQERLRADHPRPRRAARSRLRRVLPALMRLGRRRCCGESPPLLLFESARGCWWGAKHHCTFCGLNGARMAYRAKSPERVLAELAASSRAVRRSPTSRPSTTSSTCATSSALCRAADRGRSTTRFFYEVKANLKREQLRSSRAPASASSSPASRA